jgi:hypothetical protein
VRFVKWAIHYPVPDPDPEFQWPTSFKPIFFLLQKLQYLYL